MITLVSGDLGIVRRWSEGIRRGGRAFRLVDPAVVRSGTVIIDEWCIFDLGSSGDADLSALLGLVARNPGTGFVTVTARPTATEGLQLLRAGVRGYCNRLASPEVIDAVLTSVTSGEIWAGRQVTDHLLAAALGRVAAPAAPRLFRGLTRREVEIAEQVAAGRSNKIIAADAGITERTVKTHLNNIFRKTGVRNRVQLALAISQAELVPPKLSNG